MNNITINKNLNVRAEILGDSVKLQQCFINLLKNSVESIKEYNSDGMIDVSIEKRRGSFGLTIKDNGVGMTKEQVNQLGTPYFSTKEQGTGLGMMVVFSLVKAMGGKITVSSKLHRGTEVTIIFPAIEDKKVQGR